MKRLILLMALPLALTACGSFKVGYRLTFNTSDEALRTQLTLTSSKIMERRLESLKATIKDKQIQPDNGSGATITLTLADPTIGKALTAQLIQPFKMRIMKQVPDGEGQISVQGHGSFAETGITEKDIVLAEAAEDSAGKGVVKLTFLPDGRTKLAKLFQENNGKDIGIFVRDRLMSKLTIKSSDIQEYIVIRNIPSADLARVFVDDLNVGLHVTFTPLP